MTAAAGIVPSFFLSGFECSTFDWRDQGRRDLVVETQHRRHARADYELLRELGIACRAKASRGRSSTGAARTTSR